ncbi:hypothetical protein [Methylobacterium oxalidis]|uniref:Uncharacterized protein n=1 Tax=Methylobacterium oxalidis TaxID=944322 RepID=A0A512JC07_9HYPH|nr:hypothetical protein [Methylobacterium oxalidis]GEP07494.1 hypothetical protein MOX02_55320 [Methylobacterium oxalidis]GJE35449.1 hypothetical protein LDDCCGHA_5667 [Methylobacterium oxalidis]GLS66059.1 hypothetical protein GCM10007888_44410 [Methylobacterium oxalidis]
MTRPTPLADLIRTRMQELGLTEEALGRRLGYTNPAKAAGRVHALTNGLPLSAKSRFALWRLPEALEVSPALVLQAVADAEQLFADCERETAEERRLAQEAEEAAWRASFEPHAVIQTEHTVPTQITFCGLTGGARRWLMISFDLSRPPVTYVRQAVDALPEKTMACSGGGRAVMFFGRALGLIINYTPDSALRCDLEGNPLEVLDRAYRPGEVKLSFGGPPLSPTAVSRVLGFQ